MANESSVPKALSKSITKAISASAVTVSSGALTGTVAKTGLTLAHKIIIGVVATSVVVGGAIGVKQIKEASATPEESSTEMTNQSAELDAPTPITEDEIIKLLYDSLEYYDTYLYGRGYASTEKIDMGNPIIEKDGYYIEECKKYNSYDECMASLREYYSENANKKIIEETNLTAHDGKCYMNIFEGVGDPGREIKSIDSIDKIDNTTYAINMTLNNYFEEKEEPSVMYCIYENGHWVMDSINYYEPTTHIKPNSFETNSTNIHENKEENTPTTNIDTTEKVTLSTSITETPTSNMQTESVQYATPDTLPINEVDKLAKQFVAEIQTENVPDSMFTYSDASVQGIYFAEVKDDSPEQSINELHILVGYTQYLNEEYHSTIYKPRIYKNIVVDKNGKLNIKYSDGRGTGFFYDNADEYVNELKEDFIITKIK